MWRKPFLLGVLCGTLLTAGLFVLAHSLHLPQTTTATAPAPRPPIIMPARGYGDNLPRPLPRGWRAYRFNGQMIYVMPLAGAVRHF